MAFLELSPLIMPPHTDFEKSQAFVDAPNGITGLDTALVSLHDRFILTGEFGWDLIVKR